MTKKLISFYKEIDTITDIYTDKKYINQRMKELIDRVYDFGVADGFAEGYQEGKSDFTI